MTDALYERYKDALRRGHVAALRGHPDESIAAYEEAAALAPDRPLAHASRGAVLLRAGRLDDAIAAFAAALRVAPHDEAALSGRAEALSRAGRRVDAAEAFDVLAVIQETAGRLAEACDTARRALEQAESKARRRHVESLTKMLSQTIGDRDAEVSLARALRVLEGTAPARGGSTDGPAGEGRSRGAPAVQPPAAGTAAPADTARPTARPTARDGAAGMPAARDGGAETEPAKAEPAAGVDAEGVDQDGGPTADVPADESAIDAMAGDDVEAGDDAMADPTELAREADEALRSGDLATARDRLLAMARVHMAAGRYVAALDACQEALAFAPSDPDLHLALVDVYVARGWQGPAIEKLLLLGRLIELDGNAAARERFCRAVSRRFPDDERLTAMCA